MKTAEKQTHTEVRFDCTLSEMAIIHRIAKRFCEKLDPSRDIIDVQMDLVATHANGCPLDLEKLANFDDFNFAHDVAGIARHISRTTGELGGCFLPRCSKPVEADSM